MEINEKELEAKGWIRNECEHRTEKCCGEFCAALEKEEYKELYHDAEPEEIEEAKEMVNCPFQKEG